MGELNPITREEKILSGADIQPSTRLEYFLKKASENGGGGSSLPPFTAADYGKVLTLGNVDAGEETYIFPSSLPEGDPFQEITLSGTDAVAPGVTIVPSDIPNGTPAELFFDDGMHADLVWDPTNVGFYTVGQADEIYFRYRYSEWHFGGSWLEPDSQYNIFIRATISKIGPIWASLSDIPQ